MLKNSKGPQWVRSEQKLAELLAESDTGKEGAFLKHSQKSSVAHVGTRLDKNC